ncbi:MAG: LURP-one-related/scramblase family protein [Candidatus Nanohaloarchaea archaeon]
MADEEKDVVHNVDLTNDTYTVKQSLVRNKYSVYGPGGELVLKGKQKLFKMKEDFSLYNSEGDPVFRVKADSIMDIAGDYTLTDEATGEPIAVLEKNFTVFKHSWRIKDPDSRDMVARIESRSTIIDALRVFSDLVSLLPHKYSIETPEGEKIGDIKGSFSLRDRYEVHIEDSRGIPKEALVAATLTVDALEGN